MSRLTRDGTAEPVRRYQILSRERGQGNINFPCSAAPGQDWQPYPFDPYSSYTCDIHAYIYIYTYEDKIFQWFVKVSVNIYHESLLKCLAALR